MSLFAKSLLISWNKNADYAQKLVADLSDEQMVVQPAVGMNHPAWVFSHLNAYHPVMVALLQGQPFDDPQGHPFGMRSAPVADVAIYPNKSDLMAAFQHGHDQVARSVEAAEAAAFEQPMPLERWQASFPLVGNALAYLMLLHESQHLGQISAWRRVQGLASV